MKLFFLVCSFCCTFLYANNLVMTAELFLTPSAEWKNVNGILGNPQTQKLFTAKYLCFPGTASACSFRNYFEFQNAGFRVQTTPTVLKKGKKNSRINLETDWNFPADGPYLASGTESFYEGAVIQSTRNLIPGVFSPLGITQSRDAKLSYLPALRFSPQEQSSFSVFRNNSKWEITVKIQEDGKWKKTIRTVPIYHQGRFPVKNPEGIRCHIYNHRGISVLNMYCTYRRGVRKNGSPVMEQMDLTLCFLAPAPGKEVMLAELTSYCFAENAAFSKLPAAGGKTITCQVFLTVK